MATDFSLVWCKQVQISKSREGIISINLSFISVFDDPYGINELQLGDNITLFGFEFRCQKIGTDSHFKSVGLSNEQIREEKKITRPMVFKTLPTAIYKAGVLSILDNITLPPVDNPDLSLYIHTTDNLYSNDGFTSDSIFQELANILGITVYPISGFDYDVVEMQVNVQSTLTQIAQSLYQIPGISVYYNENNDLLMIPPQLKAEYDAFLKSLNYCIITGTNSKTLEFYYIIEGTYSSPEYIYANPESIIEVQSEEYAGLSTTLNYKAGVIHNKVGSVFGFAYRETEEAAHNVRLFISNSEEG